MNKKLLHQIQQKSTVKNMLHRLQKNHVQIDTNDQYNKQDTKDLQYLFNNGLVMKTTNKSVSTYSITKIGLDMIQELLKAKLSNNKDQSNQKDSTEQSKSQNQPSSRLELDHYQEDNAPMKDLISTLCKYFIWILIILIFLTSIMFLFLNDITIYHYFGLMIFYILLLLVSIIFCT